MTTPGVLSARELRMGYPDHLVGQGVDLDIQRGLFTVIIGPNACGKSTLLRTMSRLLHPLGGSVLLEGRPIHDLRAKDVAQRLGVLPQSAIAPDGITVLDLVRRGRYPHQSFIARWSVEDEAAVDAALEATRMTELADRSVDQLSGGQRQRAWVALALAQESETLLLDEPTTFLDISHQISLLDLFARLNAAAGRTMVAVLHDINHAVQYAHHLVVMKAGAVVAQGPPAQIITPELLEEVFAIEAVVIDDPLNGGPLVVPRAGLRGSQTDSSSSDPQKGSVGTHEKAGNTR